MTFTLTSSAFAYDHWSGAFTWTVVVVVVIVVFFMYYCFSFLVKRNRILIGVRDGVGSGNDSRLDSNLRPYGHKDPFYGTSVVAMTAQ